MNTYMRDYRLLVINRVCPGNNIVFIWEIPYIHALAYDHPITIAFMEKYLIVKTAFVQLDHDIVHVLLWQLLEYERAEYIYNRRLANFCVAMNLSLHKN